MLLVQAKSNAANMAWGKIPHSHVKKDSHLSLTGASHTT